MLTAQKHSWGFGVPYYPVQTIYPAVKAIFDGTTVRVGKDGRVLYEQSGYGRLEKDGVKLAPQEALYLIHRQKIAIDGYTFDSLFSEFASERNFLRSFLVYRDLRERGYVVQTGPHDFRVFRRGEKPGTGESLYLVRVLSERDPIRFTKLIEEVVASRNMRKQYVLAVVDDEEELTYYEIKLQVLADACTTLTPLSKHDAVLIGKSAMVRINPPSDLEGAGFGKRLDDERLMLSPVELLYLMGKGTVELRKGDLPISTPEYFELAARMIRNSPRKTRYTRNFGRTIIPPGPATSSGTTSGSTAARTSTRTCWYMQWKRMLRFP